MKRYLIIALAAGVAVSACKDNSTVAPQDAPTVDALKNLTTVTLRQLAIGVTAQDRASFATTGLLVLPEILARDIYRIDASENRYVLETLGGQADPGSFAGGSGFTGFYTGARAANTAILALKTAQTAPVPILRPGQFQSAFGFFRTFKALEFYRVLEQRDSIGIPLQTDDPQALTPVYCKPYVLNYIAALLDSANANLVAAGTDSILPFGGLPASFKTPARDYNTTRNFIKFNRGLKGKVDFYRAIQNRAAPDATLLNTAIAELSAALGTAVPGAVPASQFPVGIYYQFTAVEILNVRADAKISANNNFADSAQFIQVDAAAPFDPTDTRLAKVIFRPDTGTGGLVGNGLTTRRTLTSALATSANQVAPIALLRDEELVLLRAQAYAELGDATSLANARADAQSVHAAYGSNPLPAFTSVAIARRYILREKRLSLLFEGPQRLVDLRAYGYLNGNISPLTGKPYLPKELASDPYNAIFPLPRAELNARNVTTNPACSAS